MIMRLVANVLTYRPDAPLLLDAFCGAGGAGYGYWLAGFNVVGVDIAPQPRYPFFFVQGDAIAFIEQYGGLFDAIHASPPCQEYSVTRHLRDANAEIKGYTPNVQPKLIKPVRDLLVSLKRPWIIENVPQSPMPGAIQLCGSMFDLPLLRHRWFESSHLLFAPGPCRHPKGFYGVVGGKTRGYGTFTSGRFYTDAKGNRRKREGYPGKKFGEQAMGINWMTVPEMSEAVPPAYTRYIGSQLMRAVRPTA